MERESTVGPLRVLVLSGDDLTRAGLAALISELPGFSVVGQISEPGKLSDDVDLFTPDVVVWDVSDSLDRLSVLVDLRIPAVVLAPTGEAAGVAWAGGARGILPRSVARDQLAAALEAVANGLTVVDNRFAPAIAPPRTAPPPPAVENLTVRELQVLNLVAEGLPNKLIASQLAISEHTVKFHINAILGKMGASSRTQAVSLATRLGLIKL